MSEPEYVFAPVIVIGPVEDWADEILMFVPAGMVLELVVFIQSPNFNCKDVSLVGTVTWKVHFQPLPKVPSATAVAWT